MKQNKHIFIIMLAVYFLTGFAPSMAAVPEGTLEYQEVLWAKLDDTDRMVTVKEPIFRRGETIYLILRQVGTFQAGTDGKCAMDIDMTVKAPDGQIILDKPGLLGEKGHLVLENGMAESPHGIFESNVSLEPGDYSLSLTIHDTIGQTKMVVTKTFQLSDALGYQKAVFGRKNDEGKIDLVEEPVFQRGEIVNLVVLKAGTFKKGADGLHNFEIDMMVLDPKGKIALDQKNMLGKNGHTLLENDVAESPYGMYYSTVQLEAGTYIMKLTIHDLVAQKEFTVAKSFTLN